MRGIKTTFILIIAASLSLAGPILNTLSATEIEHHGFLIDESSDAICHECHGDNATQEMHPKIEGCSETTRASHPLDLYYPPKGKESQFRTSVQAQEKGIRFKSGKLTCLSCHNLKNAGKGHLAVDNFNSRLCMACHKI